MLSLRGLRGLFRGWPGVFCCCVARRVGCGGLGCFAFWVLSRVCVGCLLVVCAVVGCFCASFFRSLFCASVLAGAVPSPFAGPLFPVVASLSSSVLFASLAPLVSSSPVALGAARFGPRCPCCLSGVPFGSSVCCECASSFSPCAAAPLPVFSLRFPAFCLQVAFRLGAQWSPRLSASLVPPPRRLSPSVCAFSAFARGLLFPSLSALQAFVRLWGLCGGRVVSLSFSGPSGLFVRASFPAPCAACSL